MADAPVVDTRPPWKKKTNIGGALIILSEAATMVFPQYAIPIRLGLTAGLVLMGIGGVDRVSRYIEEWLKGK